VRRRGRGESGVTRNAAGYTRTAIFLHWLIAIMILCSAGFGMVLEDMKFSPQKLHWIAYHKWTGITIFILVALRLLWRLYRPAPPLPSAMPAWQRQAAHASHFLLYALMLATPVVGWLQSSAAGITVTWFNLVTLPSPLVKDKEFAETLMQTHAFLAFSILGLVALHAAAAIKHHVIDRDDVLTRMLPFLHSRTQEKS
jgi:cytochrome b561